MVDYFSLALSHGVLLIAFWRLAMRDDLDTEPPRAEGSDQQVAEPVTAPRKGSMRRA